MATTSERICKVEGCSNLGKMDGRGGRKSKCERHSGRDRIDRAARRLLNGGKLLNRSQHHKAVRKILGGETGDGLTVSRTCYNDCPECWAGYDHYSRGKREYILCIPEHYVLESHEANLARKKVR